VANSKSVTDQIIENAMRAGEFSNLRGLGKPLKLDADAHTPEHLRMAHKILQDNDMAPAWIMDGAELEKRHDAILANLRRAAHAYRCETCSVSEQNWSQAKKAFTKATEDYNKRLLSFNLKLPPGVQHRAALNAEREIQRALDNAQPDA
jgi:hypothetical protein